MKRTATLLAFTIAVSLSVHAKGPSKSPEQLRADYLARIQDQSVAHTEGRTSGSLWSPNGALTEIATDYKARSLNDPVTILVSVQTSAQTNGNVSSQRSFQTQSAITGLAAQLSTRGVDPILNAQSGTELKGQGQAAANSNLQSSLTGRVISVLPNGNLVVEAQRQIAMNNQRETMIVRGVVRPNDIGPENSVPSAALSNLEIELKGKGIISDSTRSPNPLTRLLLRIIGF